MSSRLFTQLRDEQGLAYQVGSTYSANTNKGVFALFIATNPENIKMPQITISKISKEAILDKYKYPNCIEFFEAFENSMINFSDRSGSSGLKKVRPDRIVDYTMELKIKGYTDRLFSSNNDYVFDIYSDRGLH